MQAGTAVLLAVLFVALIYGAYRYERRALKDYREMPEKQKHDEWIDRQY